MKILSFSVLLILGFMISGCYVQNASPDKHKTLVIASDYLKESDTTIFTSFSKKENVKIIIKEISANTLIGEVRNKTYDHGIDIVMMKSLHSVFNLNRIEMFHSINHIDEEFERNRPFMSREYNYAGFAVDPYICVTRSDTSLTVRNYNDLKQTPFINLLNEEELIVMLSPIMTKKNKVQSYDWIKEFKSSSSELKEVNRYSSRSIPALLTTYSNFQESTHSDSILAKYTNSTFPNIHSTGTFYDLRTMCIAQQAENFTTATEFIRFYQKTNNNEQISKRTNTIPIAGEQISIKLYRVNSEDLTQYFLMIQRILSRLD